MRLLALESSSSNVTTSRLLFAVAQLAYAPRLSRSQVSPVDTLQSCMSLHRSGITNETRGRAARLAPGKSVNRRLADAGTLLKSTQGLCLRAYRPDVHAVEPTDGRPCE